MGAFQGISPRAILYSNVANRHAKTAGIVKCMHGTSRCAQGEPLLVTIMYVCITAPAAVVGGKAAIEANEGLRAKLANIMSYHVVRPVPGYEAITTPFMVEGAVLQSFKNGSSITVASQSGGTIKLQGAGSSADITRRDIYACKVRSLPGLRHFHCCGSI